MNDNETLGNFCLDDHLPFPKRKRISNFTHLENFLDALFASCDFTFGVSISYSMFM